MKKKGKMKEEKKRKEIKKNENKKKRFHSSIPLRRGTASASDRH